MHYDLALISELCSELGLRHSSGPDGSIALALEPGLTLTFRNYVDEVNGKDDCVVGLEGGPSHSHGNLIFYAHGKQIELTSLDIVSGLTDGSILVCERWKGEGLIDRWLAHKNFVDEFDYMEPGEEIRVRRIFADRVPSDA